MGQSNSTDDSNSVYVPVYKRPKWPNEDWNISMDIRPVGFSGSEKSFTKEELNNLTKRLKTTADTDGTDVYLRHELVSLIKRLKTNVNSQQGSSLLQRSPTKRSRLQRTLDHIRTLRPRSPSASRNRQGTSPTTRPKNENIDVHTRLLSDNTQDSERCETSVVKPVSHHESRQRLIRLAGHLKPSLDSGLDKDTCDDVSRIAENCQWYLRRAYKAFKDVEIVSAGSIADGTKIVAADEFDLVVLMPALEQSVNKIHVISDSEHEYIRLKLVDEAGNHQGKQNTNEESQNLLGIVMDAMCSFLPQGWAIISKETKTFATRIHLDREAGSRKRAVRFDISLALPVYRNKLAEINMGDPEDVLKLPLWNQLQAALHNFDGKIFALIHSRSQTELKRISLALAEKELLLRYGSTGGPVQCLSLCKILVALFFPLVYVDGSWEAYIPAYLLKNAVFYLMDHYNSRERWEGEEVYERVVDVFLLVQKSLWPEDFGSRGSRISLYVFPGFTSFPEFCNGSCRYVPDDRRIQDGLTHSFCEGNLSYPCRFPFSEDLGTMMEHPESKSLLEQYVHKQKNTDWKFREILHNFISVLKVLFDYKGPEPWTISENNNTRKVSTL